MPEAEKQKMINEVKMIDSASEYQHCLDLANMSDDMSKTSRVLLMGKLSFLYGTAMQNQGRKKLIDLKSDEGFNLLVTRVTKDYQEKHCPPKSRLSVLFSLMRL